MPRCDRVVAADVSQHRPRVLPKAGRARQRFRAGELESIAEEPERRAGGGADNGLEHPPQSDDRFPKGFVKVSLGAIMGWREPSRPGTLPDAR